MGDDKYGDCIVVRIGNKSVLIDGGHPQDLQGQPGTSSIPEQFERIFRHEAPFPFTLVVVTHAHNDHIGCLPEMVAQEIIEPQFALVTDPDHGFPPSTRDSFEPSERLDDAGNATVQRVLAGLAEEDQSHLPLPELELFLDRAAKLGGRYKKMLATLKKRGVPVFRWGTSRENDLLPIYEALKGTGFDILAPAVKQLELCRDQIIKYDKSNKDRLVDAIANLAGSDDVVSPAELAARLYRGETRDGALVDFGIDRVGEGSALNCQSIMLKFGAGDDKVLLTGDMQFAAPEVKGIDPFMDDLLKQTIKAGPYRCVKLPHHSSYNGIDQDVWRRLGKPAIVVHSGGANDTSHPEPSILDEFKQVDDEIQFLRTDRNGLITVDLGREADAVKVSRGKADDFSKNKKRRGRDEEPASLAVPPLSPPAGPAERPPTGPGPGDDRVDVVLVRLPYDTQLLLGDYPIEVRRQRPSQRVEGARGSSDPSAQLAGGRSLENLLFVTASDKLVRNIGESEARAAMDLVNRGARLVDVAGQPNPREAVQRALAAGGYGGIVLIGGYDVLPAERVDVLDATLRAAIPPGALAEDDDDFIVWSDDGWADVDGDGLPELPVSRIPDGRSAQLVRRALTANGQAQDGAFGIRNVARPFADAVYGVMQAANGSKLVRCAPTHVSQLQRGAASKKRVYFMLHGHHRDTSRFWGDDPANRELVEAINVSAIPPEGIDIVLSGCCWGALTVQQIANSDTSVIAPRPPEDSIALACLMAGARAYVGCTGIHYSPGPDGGFFGAPMHYAFWEEVVSRNRPPAEALFEARRDYLAAMPHGRTSPLEVGIERKIYKQFTCLGLGW